jgi:subtilisin-like proprotein convertase family protein
MLGLALGAALGGISLPHAVVALSPTTAPSGTVLAAAPSRRRRRPKRRPKRRLRVVTRTFTNSTPIFIRDSNPALPYPSSIMVSGLRGNLLDVNVRLNRLQHTYPQDVDLLLVAPNGSSAVIMSDIGSGADVENLTLIIDDQAPAPLTNDPLTSGVYRPANRFDTIVDTFPAPATNTSNVALSTFTGINPNGAWKLYLVDDNGDDDGAILGGWSLIIKARARV